MEIGFGNIQADDLPVELIFNFLANPVGDVGGIAGGPRSSCPRRPVAYCP